jgi:hypothetical protein
MLIMSERIRHETGHDELAAAAAIVASASHDYLPEGEETLTKMNEDWSRRYSHLLLKSGDSPSPAEILLVEQQRSLMRFVNTLIGNAVDHGRVISEKVGPILQRLGTELTEVGGRSWEEVKKDLPKLINLAVNEIIKSQIKQRTK